MHRKGQLLPSGALGDPQFWEQSNNFRSGTRIETRKRLPRKSFLGAPERIRTSDLRFRKLCERGLSGSQCVPSALKE